MDLTTSGELPESLFRNNVPYQPTIKKSPPLLSEGGIFNGLSFVKEKS
jgi:hypothetical protein